jgi:hypothetical protein
MVCDPSGSKRHFALGSRRLIAWSRALPEIRRSGSWKATSKTWLLSTSVMIARRGCRPRGAASPAPNNQLLNGLGPTSAITRRTSGARRKARIMSASCN